MKWDGKQQRLSWTDGSVTRSLKLWIILAAIKQQHYINLELKNSSEQIIYYFFEVRDP